MAYQQLEQALKNHILEWISYHPNQGIAWPNASTGIWDPVRKIYRKNKSKFHRNGVSDIIGIWRGRPLFIEVKSPTGRPSEEQERFLTEVRSYGSIAILAYDLRDVVTVLQGIE